MAFNFNASFECNFLSHLCSRLSFRCDWTENHVILICREIKVNGGHLVHTIGSISITSSSENTNATPHSIQFKGQRKDNFR